VPQGFGDGFDCSVTLLTRKAPLMDPNHEAEAVWKAFGYSSVSLSNDSNAPLDPASSLHVEGSFETTHVMAEDNAKKSTMINIAQDGMPPAGDAT
jgi:hypothetical protein